MGKATQAKRSRPAEHVAAAALLPLLAGVGALTPLAPLPAQETASPPEASQATRAAVQAAGAWLELIDGGRYEAAWETAGDEFRGVVTVRAWERRISSLRRGIGAVRARSLSSTEETDSLPGGKEGDYVVVTFDSAFDTLTDAVETVIVSRQEAGGWKPVGYFVRPTREEGGELHVERRASEARIM